MHPEQMELRALKSMFHLGGKPSLPSTIGTQQGECRGVLHKYQVLGTILFIVMF